MTFIFRFSSRVAASVLIAGECSTTLARTRADYSEVAARIASSTSKGMDSVCTGVIVHFGQVSVLGGLQLPSFADV